MKYSVIIPVYNCEQYIEQSIQSVLNQRREDVELVIVNDGSTDKTLQIIQAYESATVKIINKKNSGALDTWKRGVQESTGDNICFLDSDDLLAENFFEVIDRYIDQHDIVLFDFYRMYKDGMQKAKVNTLPYGEVSKKDLEKIKYDYYTYYEMYSCYRWDKVIKAEIVKKTVEKINWKVNYYEDLISGLLNVLASERVVYLEENLYYYRMRNGSMTKKINDRIFADNIIVSNAMAEITQAAGYSDFAQKRRKSFFLFFYAMWSMKTKKKIKRARVTLQDIKCSDKLGRRIVLTLYKFHLYALYRGIWAMSHRNVGEKNQSFD